MEAPRRAKPSQRTTFQSHFQRSLSPSGRFCSSSIAAAPAPSRAALVARRTISPTRVAIARSVSPSSSPTVRFAASPGRHAGTRAATPSHHAHPKKTCMCSPTTHPGSFRCSLHNGKKFPGYNGHSNARTNQHHVNTASHQLNMRRSAMTNSLVRIGTVEGDLVKRALAALIRPSSHSLRRRGDFQPKPSRLSVMVMAEDS